MRNTLQKRYEGFLNTPLLWKKNPLFNLTQFEINTTLHKLAINLDENLRLGKYVERFVSFELKQQHNISILAENIQIQKDKLTLGELDCLLLKDGKPIHLEIIYKFYVYDATVGTSEIDHFIGPNRKDSLIEKLEKLRDKQLPLLYADDCKSYLKTIDLKSKNISQHVYFKAQLFLPLAHQNTRLLTLNNDCVVGFYIRADELHEFKDCKFYLPNKKNWLITPHINVDWSNFESFTFIAKDFFKQKYASLVWVKFKNGLLNKVFLVWW
ncbi:DUF1853 family protein [Hyunsoonleella sp. 2307UL5-6]|uniref:DUF1853 family protein n=1 Tax=Hyunsoonleella sp. 2307UL5-6 TaxID=3384768 RepID=UPI0039BCA371